MVVTINTLGGLHCHNHAQVALSGFSNSSGAPARMLIVFAPGPPREEYFRELADIRSAGRKLTE